MIPQRLGTILQESSQDTMQQLKGWVAASLTSSHGESQQSSDITAKDVKLSKLYCSSEDGFTPASFYKRCQGKSNTITVVRDFQDSVYGCFVDTKWAAGNHDDDTFRSHSSPASFMFLLSARGTASCSKISSNIAVHQHRTWMPRFNLAAPLEQDLLPSAPYLILGTESPDSPSFSNVVNLFGDRHRRHQRLRSHDETQIASVEVYEATLLQPETARQRVPTEIPVGINRESSHDAEGLSSTRKVFQQTEQNLLAEKHTLDVAERKALDDIMFMEDHVSREGRLIRYHVGEHEFLVSSLILLQDPTSKLGSMSFSKKVRSSSTIPEVFLDLDAQHFETILSVLRMKHLQKPLPEDHRDKVIKPGCQFLQPITLRVRVEDHESFSQMLSFLKISNRLVYGTDGLITTREGGIPIPEQDHVLYQFCCKGDHVTFDNYQDWIENKGDPEICGHREPEPRAIFTQDSEGKTVEKTRSPPPYPSPPRYTHSTSQDRLEGSLPPINEVDQQHDDVLVPPPPPPKYNMELDLSEVQKKVGEAVEFVKEAANLAKGVGQVFLKNMEQDFDHFLKGMVPSQCEGFAEFFNRKHDHHQKGDFPSSGDCYSRDYPRGWPSRRCWHH